MASKIVVPQDILDEIRYAGIEKAKKDKEDLGLLLGFYDEEDDSVVISKRLHQVTIAGELDLADWLRVFLAAPRIGYVYMRTFSHLHLKKLKETGKTPVRVAYHTHPYGYWSAYDRKNFDRRDPAVLLYRADEDEFVACNSDLEMIGVVPRPLFIPCIL